VEGGGRHHRQDIITRRQWEERNLPRPRVFKKLGDAGLLGITASEGGGKGLDYAYAMVMRKSLGTAMRLGASWRSACRPHGHACAGPLRIDEIPPRSCALDSGDYVACLGVSEVAQSDVASSQTQRAVGCRLLINSQDVDHNAPRPLDVPIGQYREGGCTEHVLIFLPHEDQGVQIARNSTISQAISDTAQIFFDDVRCRVLPTHGHEAWASLPDAALSMRNGCGRHLSRGRH